MAWYKAGSIAISGTAVTGTGTNWSDNKIGIGPGQALLIPAAGTVRMFEILRVDSATHITLTSDAGTVPAGQVYAIMSFYTDSVPDFARRLSAQLSYYQSQMDGWQQIMTGTGNITLTDPNGMQVTISSFKKLTDDMNNKVDKSALGNSSSRNVGITAGTVAAGDDSRITGAMQKSGGTVNGDFDFTGTTTLNGQKNVRFKGFRDTSRPEGANNNDLVISTPTNPGAGAYACQLVYQWYADGWITGIKRNAGYGTNSFGIYFNGASTGSGREWNFNVDGNAYGGQWVNSCDIRHKSKLVPVENPLSAVLSFRGMAFDVKDGARSVGLIAQDVERWCPEAIKVYGDRTFSDGTVIKDFKYIDSTGVSAAYHTEAIRELFRLIELALNDPDSCRSRIAEIKELVTTSEASS